MALSDEEKERLLRVIFPDSQDETIALARALCPFAEAASDELMLICVAMVEAKGDANAVAEALGFSVARARAHLQSNIAGRIMRELARHRVSGEGFVVATAALMDIASSSSQSGGARNKAAKTLIDIGEAEGFKSSAPGDGGKDLNTMTLLELERYVDSIKKDLVAVAHIPTPKTLIDSQ